jgi:hypothetical protein
MALAAFGDECERNRTFEIQRDREIAECVKALINLQGALDAVKPFAARFKQPRTGALAALPLWTEPGGVIRFPSHVDVLNLSFLLQHGGKDVFNWVQAIEGAMNNVETSSVARHELVTGAEVRGRLMTWHELHGSFPTHEKWEEILGPPVFQMLRNSTEIVAQQSERAQDLLVTHLEKIQKWFAAIYPTATFQPVRI